MRRILFIVGAVACGVTFICTLLPENALFALAAVFAAAIAAMVVLRRKLRFASLWIAMLATALAFAGAYTANYFCAVKPVCSLNGMTGRVAATVVDEPRHGNGFTRIKVRTDSLDIEGAPQDFTFELLVFQNTEVDVSDRITANVDFGLPNGNYKSGFDSQKMYISGVTGALQSVEPSGEVALYKRVVDLRRGIRNTILQNFTREKAGVLCGILLGETDYMPDETLSAFRATGLSHIMAVSGLHISIISAAVLWILKRLSIKRRISSLIAMVFVIFIVALTGFSPSAVRAGMMFCIFLAGMFLFREADGLNSLGIAASVMLLIDPYYITNVSFVLSVSAVLGILTIQPFLSKRIMARVRITGFWYKVIYMTVTLVTVSVAAGIAVLPVTAVFFGTVPAIGALTNVFISYPAFAALILAAFSVPIYGISAISALIRPLFYVISGILDYVLFTVKLLGKIPFASLPVKDDYIGVWIGATLIIIAALLIMRRIKRRALIAVLLSICLLICGVVSNAVFDSGVTRVAVLDVDNGLCTVVSRGDRAIVIGGGGGKKAAYALSDYLAGAGIKQAELLVLPDVGKNLTDGTEHIVRLGLVKNVTGPGDAEINTGGARYYPMDGKSISFWGDCRLTPVSGEGGTALVLELGKTVCIITARGGDFSSVKDKTGTPDMVICAPEAPRGVKYGPDTAFLICGKISDCYSTLKSTFGSGLRGMVISGSGDIVAKTRNDGYVTYRREK